MVGTKEEADRLFKEGFKEFEQDNPEVGRSCYKQAEKIYVSLLEEIYASPFENDPNSEQLVRLLQILITLGHINRQYGDCGGDNQYTSDVRYYYLAAGFYEESLGLIPKDVEMMSEFRSNTYNCLGITLLKLGFQNEALICYMKALRCLYNSSDHIPMEKIVDSGKQLFEINSDTLGDGRSVWDDRSIPPYR